MVEDKQLAEELAALNRAYRERLSGQFDELEEIARRLVADPAKAGGGEMLGELMGLAHKMAGASGTFGMPRLGDRARSLEEFCDTMMKAGQPPSGDQLAAIHEKVAACRREAEAPPE
jgi:HPt (histidine-containing phosphotransfer) domain-containing protein